MKDSAFEFEQPLCEVRLLIFEDLICIRHGGIEYKSVGQDDGHRVNRVVGIFDHAATHAAGVVREDAAHHTGINRGGVRANAPTQRFEYIIDKSTDDTG